MSKLIKLIIRLPFALLAIIIMNFSFILFWLFMSEGILDSKILKEHNADVLDWLISRAKNSSEGGSDGQ